MKRKVKPVTYTIPIELDSILHQRITKGEISQFVTKALWDALQKEENAVLYECLEADKDLGNLELRESFSALEGEDFRDIEAFDFDKDSDEK